MKTGSIQPSRQTTSSENIKKKSKADQQDSNDFSKALNKNKKNDKLNPEDLLKAIKPENQSRGDTILNQTQITSENITKTNATESIEKINQIVDKITLANAKDTKEVKIDFNKNLLPGTEAIISKKGGNVTIEFNTTSADSFNFLARGEQSLTQQLQNKFGNNVAVNINMQGDTDTGDGRSRNSFFAEDEEMEN